MNVNKKNFSCIIPARYASSRLPGKPLIKILGTPMIIRVLERISSWDLFDEIRVAIDDVRVKEVCEEYGYKTIMTPENCISGTDRASWAVENINSEAVAVIMGDEPLIAENDVRLLIKKFEENKNSVIALKRKINNMQDVISNSTIKAVCGIDDDLLFLSRSPIPYPQTDSVFDYYKIIGCYMFPIEILKLHKKLKIGYLEKAEALDSFRLLENNIKIKCFNTDSNYFSIDTFKDIRKCEEIINAKQQKGGK